MDWGSTSPLFYSDVSLLDLAFCTFQGLALSFTASVRRHLRSGPWKCVVVAAVATRCCEFLLVTRKAQLGAGLDSLIHTAGKEGSDLPFTKSYDHTDEHHGVVVDTVITGLGRIASKSERHLTWNSVLLRLESTRSALKFHECGSGLQHTN